MLLALIVLTFTSLLVSASETVILEVHDKRDLAVPGSMDLSLIRIVYNNETGLLDLIVTYYGQIPPRFVDLMINVSVRYRTSKTPLLTFYVEKSRGLLSLTYLSHNKTIAASSIRFRDRSLIARFNLSDVKMRIRKGMYLAEVLSKVVSWDVFDDIIYRVGGRSKIRVDGWPYDWRIIGFLGTQIEGRDTYYGIKGEGLDMDYKATYLTDNSTHLFIRVDPIEELKPIPHLIRELNLLIDLDDDNSTGFRSDGIGAEYYAVINYTLGPKGATLGFSSLYVWNVTEGVFRKIYNGSFELSRVLARVLEGVIPLPHIDLGDKIRVKVWVDNVVVDRAEAEVWIRQDK